MAKIAVVVVVVVAAAAAAGRSAAAPPTIAARCGTPGVAARSVQIPTADGVRLAGAELGHGSVGIVLMPENPDDLCTWIHEATRFVAAGFIVLDIDPRCAGYSTCVASSHPRFDLDMAAAAAWLERVTSRPVGLVGAGYSGSLAALVAATELRAPPFAVAVLSPPSLSVLVGQGYLTPSAATRRLHAPLFIAASKGDSTYAAAARALYKQATGSKRRRLLQLPNADHGVGILGANAGAHAALVAFLKQTAP
jgi:hypothetical protein